MTWARPWEWQAVADAKGPGRVWKPNKAAERRYAKQLMSVATEVTGLLGKSLSPEEKQKKLEAYADSLDSWAHQAASNMMRAAKHDNEQSWRAAAQKMGIDLKGLLGVDIEDAVKRKVEENVLLIKSIPANAALRVGEMAQKAVVEGTRAETLAKKIAKQSDVAMHRARTIALTEVSKAQTALTQARAQGAGSEGYIWRTTRDGQRRNSHASMEGRFVRWDKPPTLDGMTGHAGEFPNCRCYPEPVVPEAGGKAVTGSPLPSMEEEKAAGEIKLRSHWERENNNPVIPHREKTRLHNVERSEFVPEKLTKYSMDLTSERGHHKARVWESALGMTKRHAKEVEAQIMEQIPKLKASSKENDEWGEKYTVIVPVTGPNGRTVDVTTGWIYKRDNKTGRVSSKPRLTTCYVR